MMWHAYLKEAQQIESIVGKYSFLTYQIWDGVCIIHDFYIRPEYRGFRGAREALGIANQIKAIAKASKCFGMVSEVYKANPMHEYVVKLDCHWGFRVAETTEFKTILEMTLD